MLIEPLSAGGYQPERHWGSDDLIEHHPVLKSHRLPAGEFVAENGQRLVVERFAWHPPRPEQRPRFRCPQCDRGCYCLHGCDDGLYRCRKCSDLDYSCRHVGRAGWRFRKNRAELARYRQRVLAAIDRRLKESKP